MLKDNKKLIVLTSMITLLPILIGLILWNRLPEQVPIHFNMQGEADGWSGKGMAVFGLPLICLGVHLICTFATAVEPRIENTAAKVLKIVYWIAPCTALFCALSVYGAALGMDIDVAMITEVLVGIAFVVVGNYLPKCRQNYVLGIKRPWTLADEENWNRTHRLAGRIWVPCGILFIINAFLNVGGIWTIFIMMFLLVIVPTAYSAIIFYRKRK